MQAGSVGGVGSPEAERAILALRIRSMLLLAAPLSKNLDRWLCVLTLR